tara:strand:- start:246 stop:827 length:582 start_codon:yes stop_codon:yes gene_type:complete
MKNLFRLLILLCVSIFTLSCGDGDATSPQDPANNVLSTPDGDFQITGAILEDYGDWDGENYNLDFSFTTEGLTYSSSNDALSGAGIGAYFEMISPSAGYLADGDYNYTDDWDSDSTGAFTYTGSSDFRDVTDGENWVYNEIHYPQATVTIGRNGSSYTFSYSSGSYSIQYSGVPVLVDRTSRSMASKKGVLNR